MATSLLVDDRLALYIHVPFCVQRCTYCDFYSLTLQPQSDEVAAFFTALKAQVTALSLDGRFAGRQLSSVYFGGGTPSYVHQYLPAALAHIADCFTLSSDCEITFEANPESFNAQVATTLAKAGFNRVSLGVQSLNDHCLKLIGRAHDEQTAWAALEAAASADYRVSADIILGLPDAFELERSVAAAQWERLLGLVDHIAVYPLTVEAGTLLETLVDADQLCLPDEDRVTQQMLDMQELLASHGFERYEISSYCRPGEESRQNLRYWRGGDYLGLGPSAASMLNNPAGKPAGSRVRFVMHERLEDYVAHAADLKHPHAEDDYLSPAEARREDVMLALRTKQGATIHAIQAAGLTDICDELVEKGLLEKAECVHTPGYYRCTQQGWLLGNIVFAAVWTAN